jgi:hypothetical protein
MYSKKIIQNLKPEWYMQLSSKEKIAKQKEMQKLHNEMWNDKPKQVLSGTILVAKYTRKNITDGKKYKVINYFATLISTVYFPEWNEFVTLKNDNGYTVKMNLNNFSLT